MAVAENPMDGKKDQSAGLASKREAAYEAHGWREGGDWMQKHRRNHPNGQEIIRRNHPKTETNGATLSPTSTYKTRHVGKVRYGRQFTMIIETYMPKCIEIWPQINFLYFCPKN